METKCISCTSTTPRWKALYPDGSWRYACKRCKAKLKGISITFPVAKLVKLEER